MDNKRISCFLLVFIVLPVVQSKCPQFMALSGVSQSGNITSPGWPSPYPPDAICAYKLQGEAWQGLKITFHYFDLEPPFSAGCLNDYLELNTVDTKGQRTFRGRYCGKSPPPPILFLHPVVELVFRSNHAAHHDGFSASYEFVDESIIAAPRLNATSPCGNTIQGIGGLVLSPGYPRGYAAGLDCIWLIRAKYNHVVYLRIQHLEFQGSTANCQKAQLRIYDGYEHSLEEYAVLKRYCGDTRFYKAEDDKFVLSERNRLLIRFTTTEPSKPINDTMTHVGFKLVWSDVEYLTPDNCTKSSKFACQETQVCLSPHHKGTSSCLDLKHYCISSQLACDGLSNCSEFDSSDERNCSKTPLVLKVVAVPLAVLSCSLFLCFLWYKRKNKKNRKSINDGGGGGGGGRQQNGNKNDTKRREIEEEEEGGGCCFCSKLWRCCCKKKKNKKRGKNEENNIEEKGSGQEPLTRNPIYYKHELESPMASDIVSPASGFSDTESDMGGHQQQPPIYCPAHGPVHFVPFRYLRHFPLLPVVQEVNYNNDIYNDEGGSLYSTSQNSDMILYEDKGGGVGSNNDPISGNYKAPPTLHPNSSSGLSLGFVQEWRMKQLQSRTRVQRADAIYMSDDKSSAQSSPGRICPRCLEKEKILEYSSSTNKINSLSLLEKQQFDSGIDVATAVAAEPVKNVSFETCTSSDSAFSGGGAGYRQRLFGGWKENKFCTPMVEEVTQTDPSNGHESLCGCGGGEVYQCETVTTFGVNPDGGIKKSKATDV